LSSGATGSGFDRSLSCRVRDLDLVFAGRIKDGQLSGIRRAATTDAQIRLDLASDDLLALVDGTLKLAPAWASGQVKVHAGVRDLLKLRSMF
jgi:predicted lipid carrier protein YhbT